MRSTTRSSRVAATSSPAGITVTPERAKLVDFTIPTKTKVKEIIVTGPGAAVLTTVDSLSGLAVAVRDKSIQFETLQKLNDTFKQQGKAPIQIRTVPTALEDEDLLEMTNAGLLKAIVVDDYDATFWKQILPDITLHPEIAVREEGDLAWAVRKNSPKLIAAMNPIIKANGEGTLFGNAAAAEVPEEHEAGEKRHVARPNSRTSRSSLRSSVSTARSTASITC